MAIAFRIAMPIIAIMHTHQVIEYFGTQQAVADALGIKQSSVAGWGEFPPDLRQLQIEMLTDGKLKAESTCYPKTDAARGNEGRGDKVIA
jgi:hypothetical protein